MSENKLVFQQIHDALQTLQLLKPYHQQIQYFDEYYQDPVRLLIIGEFSAGKSTIINTLLGRDVAAIGAIATTAVPTFFKYSTEEYAEIVYGDGTMERRSLQETMSLNSEREATTRQQRLKLQKINVYLKHPILQNIVIVDSPGLNSSNSEHTAHTVNVMQQVDDAMWIFQYGHVGRNTEFEQLNELRKVDIHPIGVVNMIDNADEDDLTPYLQYEFQKLEGRIRSILGISAIEAKEALVTNDSELLKISGFPQFIQTLMAVKKRTDEKDARFKKQLTPFWQTFSKEIEMLLQGELYESKVSQLQSYSKSFRMEFNEASNSIDREVEQAKETYVQFLQFANVAEGQDFIEWFQSPFMTQVLDDAVYREIADYVVPMAKYNEAVEKLDKDILYFNESVRYSTPGIFDIIGRLRYGKGNFEQIRQQRKQLQQQEKALLKRYKQLKKQLKAFKKCVNGHVDKFNAGLNICAAQLQQTIHTKIAERAKLVTLIEQDQRLLQQMSYELQPFETLIENVQQVEKHIVPTLSKAYVLRHDVIIEHVEQDLMDLLANIRTDEQFSIEPLQLQHELEIPPLRKSRAELRMMVLRNYRPFALFAAIVLVMGLIVGNHLWTIRDVPELQAEEGERVVEEEVTQPVEEAKELPFLQPSEQYDGAIGVVEIRRDNFIYPSNELYSDPVYQVAQQTVWPVYNIEENWYEIQDGYWVHQSYSDYQDLYTVENAVGNLSNPLAKVTAAEGEYMVYIDGDAKFDLPKGTYDVYAFDGTERLQIGEQAWILVTEETRMIQPKLQLVTSEPIIGYVTTNTAPLAVTDSGNEVIGILLEQRRLPVYENVPYSARVGRDVWVDLVGDVAEIELVHTSNVDNALLFVTSENVAIFSAPEQSAEKIGTASKYSFYKIYEVLGQSSWYKIGPNEWIQNANTVQQLTLTGYQIGYVNVLVNNLNARSAPSLNAQVYEQYQPNDALRVYGISDDLQWLQVDGGLWINANPEYISFEPI